MSGYGALRAVVLLAVACIFPPLLAACQHHPPPQVVDRSYHDRPAERVTRGQHEVRRGETLYSIAWRYGWDFRQLAANNDIAAPFTIYPGQVIELTPKTASSRPTSTPSAGAARGVATSQPPSRSAPSASASGEDAPTPARPSPPAASRTTGPIAWQWPADGAILETFASGQQGRRGIAISGPLGSPVVAAADGQVVYRGSGLTGYGNLLIIRHSDQWLTAYAHNQQLLVAEGDRVKGGQRIATLGSSGTFRHQLHFEMRRDGKPVNPLQHLPSR